jgi:hypothetical protein
LDELAPTCPALLSTWMVRALYVDRPLLAVMLNGSAPVLLLGTVKTTWVSDQLRVLSVLPLSFRVPVPLVAPKPMPLMVTVRKVVLSFVRT